MNWLQMSKMPHVDMLNALENSSRYEVSGMDVDDERELLEKYDSTMILYCNNDAYSVCPHIRLYLHLELFILKKISVR